MDIQLLNGTAFTVLVDGDELREEHIDLASITPSDTERLLKSAFSQLGLKREPKIRLELFPGRDELLMFVRPTRREPFFLSFDGLEPLLSAAGDWRGDAASTMWYIDGRYILAVWPLDASDDCRAAAEFGRMLDVPPEYAHHLSEHGRVLSSPDALGMLRREFLESR